MTKLDVLKAARKLIVNKENWSQEYFARDLLGKSTCLLSSSATSFCLIGAICKAANIDPIGEMDEELAYEDYMQFIGAYINGQDPTIYNDHSEHTDVLALMDRIINDLEPAQ